MSVLHSFICPNNILWYGSTNLAICSSTLGHLSCFHFGAVVTCFAMNVSVQVVFWIFVFNSLGCISTRGITGSYGNFWGMARLSSTEKAPFYVLTSKAVSEGPISLHPCQSLLFSIFLIIVIPGGVKYHLTVVLIGISLMTRLVSICCKPFINFDSFAEFRKNWFLYLS